MRMKKKGQITTFIIIGIILLFASALIFFIREKSSGNLLERNIRATEEIPGELNPLKAFVTTCTKDLLSDGVKKLGMRGGYIDPMDFELSGQKIFYRGLEPTESDLVEFTQGLYIPYWWYLSSSNDCTGSCFFDSNVPGLHESTGDAADTSIEIQLERYVLRELDGCLRGFEDFKEQGYIVTEKSEPKIEVAITSDSVVALMTYPIEVYAEDIQAKVSQFYVSIDVDIKEIYELAIDIVNAQKNFSFLEKNTLELITAFSGVDENKLPPKSATRFEPMSRIMWTRSWVKEKISEILMTYTQMMQVYGTANYDRYIVSETTSDYQVIQRMYDNMILPIEVMHADVPEGQPIYPGLVADFQYFSLWPIYFDVNSDGEIIRPEHLFTEQLSFMGLQRYNTLYDVSYPVMVSIKDPNAFEGDGFTFFFMIEANIRNNDALMPEFVPLNGTSSTKKTMFCDEDKRNSGNVTLHVKDRHSFEKIEDAIIAYTCIDESCIIGYTDEEGKLVTKLPVCFGGVLNVVKDGYLSNGARLSTSVRMEAELDVRLRKKLNLPVKVYKKQFTQVGGTVWDLNPNQLTLNRLNEGTIMFKLLSDELEEDFSTGISFDGDNNGEANLTLPPGWYNLSGSLFYNGDVIIPEETRSENFISYTLPGIDFSANGSKFQEGGIELDYVELPFDLVNQSRRLKVYLVSLNPDSFDEIEDVENIGTYNNYSRDYRIYFEPEFE